MTHHIYLLGLMLCNGSVTIETFAPLWADDCKWIRYNESFNNWLQPRLDRRWPDCSTNTTRAASALHRHVWKRHGTCTKMPQSTYFATALDLRDSYEAYGPIRLCLDLGLHRVDCP